MTRTSVTLVVCAALVVLSITTVAPPVEARDRGGVTQIDDCTTITEPGQYALGRNITGGGTGENFTYLSQSCLVVESDDVVLEGHNHRVNGIGVSDTTGIAVVGTPTDAVENVTIRNVTVTEWNQGVAVRRGERVAVRNVTLSNNAFGMEVEQSTRVNLTQSTVRDNLLGVYEDRHSEELVLTGTSFETNYAGDVVSDTATSHRLTPGSPANRSRLTAGRVAA